MRLVSRWSLAAVGLMAFVSRPGLAQGQDDSAQLAARVAQLERMVAESRMHYASYGEDGEEGEEGEDGDHTSACGGCGDCDSCSHKICVGQDFFNDTCRPCTYYGGFELVYLRPYFSENRLTNAANDIGFDESWRTWFGSQRADGLGWRGRYWEFDRGSGAVGAEFRTLDFELTQAVDYRYWSFLFAGGLRYGESQANNGNFAGDGFDGTGLTAAIEAYRDLFGYSNLRMATRARWSLLFGNSKSGAAVDRDDLVNIMEISMGPQWTKQLSSGAMLTLGTGLEAQYWNNGIGVDTQDFGFFGFGVSAVVAR